MLKPFQYHDVPRNKILYTLTRNSSLHCDSVRRTFLKFIDVNLEPRRWINVFE